MSFTVHTTIKVRLYPTQEQAELFDKTIHCCRYLWNQMLSDEQEFYAATDRHFIPAPAKYKKSAPFLKEADSQALVCVHQNIQRAFRQFFEQPDRYGYPAFKKKKTGKSSYKTSCHYPPSGGPPSIRLEGNGIVLPKVKWVKAKLHRRPLHWWTLKYAVITRNASGKYDCSLVYEYEQKQQAAETPFPESVLGIAFSRKYLYADSNGETGCIPEWMQNSAKKLAETRQKLLRMQEGSHNYEQQVEKLRNLYEHIANQRKDYIHKESRRIANACDAVCVRVPNLTEMARNLKLDGIKDSGFGMFRYCLSYKLDRQGKSFIEIDPWFPAVKTCNACGSVNDNLRPGGRSWICPACGQKLVRAANAAQNIRKQGILLLAEKQ